MSIQQLPKVNENMKMDELINLVGILIKEVSYLFDGNIDAKNIRANSITTELLKANAIIAEKIAAGAIIAEKIAAGAITTDKIAADAVTADKIDVNELSAISANLGTILAGQIFGILIQGSLIQTAAPGNYPRIEFSSTDKLILAERNSDSKVTLDPDLLGEMGFFFSTIGTQAIVGLNSTGVFGVGTNIGNAEIFSLGGFLDIYSWLNKVRFNSWDNIFSKNENRTLQQELNNLQNQINSLNSRVTALGG